MLILTAVLPIVILLAVSAFFSAALIAARRVNRMVSDRERLQGAALLGSTVLNILAASLTTALLTSYFGSHTAIVATTVVMTAVILVFVEILPKTPIIAAMHWPVWRVLALFGVKPGAAETAEEAAHEDIRGAVALHTREGHVDREHRDMIGGILNLRELKIGDVMMHRRQMTALDVDRPAAEIVAAVTESEHTRIPLWRGEPDNIIGVLNAKHLAQTLVEHRGKLDALDIEALAGAPWFVPDTTTLEEQLEAFRERRSRFAMVVDEYGTLQGLVTVEDILAEIFGELPDEQRRPSRPDVRQRADGSYLVDGTVAVRDLNREYEWNLPDEGATTIAGLVIQETGTIPDTGQLFAFFGFRFEVLRRQRNQITALRVTPPAPG